MELTNVRNPQWGNAAHTKINVEVTHPVLGELPFTADRDDVEEHSRVLFAEAESGLFGAILEYVAPQQIVNIPREISKAQGIATLMEYGYWPAVNTYLTTQAPPETLIFFNAVTVFNRASPLLLQIQGLLGISDEVVDQMFIAGAKKVI